MYHINMTQQGGTKMTYNETVQEMVNNAIELEGDYIPVVGGAGCLVGEGDLNIAIAVFKNLLENRAVNTTVLDDEYLVVCDDTLISALDGCREVPTPTAEKALESITRALEKAGVLGYYISDLEALAKAAIR